MAEEIGWLIEHHDTTPRHQWLRAVKYQGRGVAGLEWTEDASMALRFARQVDAIDFAWLFPEVTSSANITQHIWSDPLGAHPTTGGT